MGMSLRALQRTHNVTWRTVRRALDGQWPQPRKKQRRKESRLDPYKPLIDGMLRADLDAPPKQRHTAQRIYDRLIGDHAAEDISYPMVRVHVKDRRKEIRRQAGVGPDAMFVPQTHLPGAEAEVDFGDVHIMLAGKMTKVYLFSMRLSYSGKAVHRVFASCGQEAFFEGHVHAFRTLGGIPRGRIRYDDLRAAVERVLGLSRARVENDRSTAFGSHWGVDAFYCRPGPRGRLADRAECHGRSVGPGRRRPASADGAVVHSAGQPLRSGHGALQLLLGTGPLHRPPAAGAAPRQRQHSCASQAPSPARPFTDTRLCAAIVDRLTFNGSIIQTGPAPNPNASPTPKPRPHQCRPAD